MGGSFSAAGGAIFDTILHALGDAWVSAASSVLTTTLAALDATTHVDLSAAWFRANVRVIGTVSLPVIVGLFTLQVITGVIRREPGALGRAVVGLVQALLGTTIALAATQALLVATDEICRFIAASAGTTVVGAAKRFLQLTWLSGPAAVPLIQMIFSIAVIIGALMLWLVLLFRKAALIIVAVFAWIAFAGSVWDVTRVWTRRWIETVAALVFCKIFIVVVFVVGMSAFGGAGPSDPGSSGAISEDTGLAQGLSDLLVGVMLLAMSICAPWLTWRFVHWSGVEAAAALHTAMASSPVPSVAHGGVNQAKFTAQWAITSMILGRAGFSGGGAGRPPSGASPGVGGAAGGAAPPPPPRPPTSSAPAAPSVPSGARSPASPSPASSSSPISSTRPGIRGNSGGKRDR